MDAQPSRQVPAWKFGPAYLDQIESAFAYHRPDEAGQAKCDAIRKRLKSAAFDLVAVCPPSRETSLALTKLEEAMQHAIAAVVRHPPPPSAPS